jgi:hypothetical protein
VSHYFVDTSSNVALNTIPVRVKNCKQRGTRFRAGLVAAAFAAFVGLGSYVFGEEAPVQSGTVPAQPSAKTPKAETAAKKERPPARKLTGAELYSMHCNRCHPERYPTERTAAQWKTILLHMRVRANLPAEQARTILKYLQDNSGR